MRPASSPAAIETARLTRYYGRRRGIEDLDLTVRTGEVFGFLGPNGAGKTTTIRLLLDLLRPSRGQARVFEPGRLALATLNALPLAWLFAALALLASSLTDQPRSAGFAAGVVVVASYVLETARLVSPAFAWWRPLSVFAHHKASVELLPTAGSGCTVRNL